MDEQMAIVYETLQELGVVNRVLITAFNKQDKLEEPEIIRDFKADKVIRISARTGEGITELLEVIEEKLRNQKVEIQLIRKYGELMEEIYREDGIHIRAYVPAELYEKVVRRYEQEE